MVFTGFGVLLGLIWYAHEGEVQESLVASQFAAATETSADVAISSQRLTLLQYGLVSNRPSVLASRIYEEIRKESAALSEKLQQLTETSNVAPLSEETRKVAQDLRSLGETFNATSGALLVSLGESDSAKL